MPLDLQQLRKRKGNHVKIYPPAIRLSQASPFTRLPTTDEDWRLGEVDGEAITIENLRLHTSFPLALHDIDKLTPEQRGEGYSILWLHVQLTTRGDVAITSSPLPRTAFPDGNELFPKRVDHKDTGTFASASSPPWIAFANSYANVARLVARTSRGDLSGMPMVFLYRHALELLLKAIIVEFGSQSETERLNLFKTHSLTTYFNQVVDLANDIARPLTTEVSLFLKKFQNNDPKGMRARYPWNTKGNPEPIKNRDSFHASLFISDCDKALTELAELYDALAKDRYEPPDSEA